MTEPSHTLTPQAPPGAELRERVEAAGDRLARAFGQLIAGFPGAPLGPQRLSEVLGETVVTTSRLLKALRASDPILVVHYLPGPDPLRRLVVGAKKNGAPKAIAAETDLAIDEFEALIREEAGDRGSLGAILSDWVPELRNEFEVRRRQAVFKATSELRGMSCATSLSSLLLHPSEDGEHIDVVCVDGLFGLRRLRPAAQLRLTTRRIPGEGTADAQQERHPFNLAGSRVEDVQDARLDQFCVAPAAPMEVVRLGEDLHYVLGESGFGPDSAVDIVQAEVNRNELVHPNHEEGDGERFVFHIVAAPSKAMIFDVHIHESLIGDRRPELLLYDTTLQGPARAHDPDREFDRSDPSESITELGTNLNQKRVPEIPTYVDLMRHVFGELNWKSETMRGFRVRADFPLVSAQYVYTLPLRG